MCSEIFSVWNKSSENAAVCYPPQQLVYLSAFQTIHNPTYLLLTSEVSTKLSIACYELQNAEQEEVGNL